MDRDIVKKRGRTRKENYEGRAREIVKRRNDGGGRRRWAGITADVDSKTVGTKAGETGRLFESRWRLRGRSAFRG